MPADYYLALQTNDLLHDLVMTVEGDLLSIPLSLSVYLDADGNFDPALPQSDADWYLPGSLADGTSIAPNQLPQNVSVIAAFTDDTGTIVPPPPGHTDATFNLEDTTGYLGFAMNAGTGADPDFALVSSSATFGADHTARVTLLAADYGGATRVHATSGSFTATEVQVPLDVDGNGIPDAGWKAFEKLWDLQSSTFVYGLLAEVDDDSAAAADLDHQPDGNGFLGDNLIQYEEYRGFVFNGWHYRTDPRKKDAFVFLQGFHENRLYDVLAAELRLHVLEQSDISAQRNVNFNYAGISDHIDQQAILVLEAGSSQSSALGRTACADVLPFVCFPNAIGSQDDWNPLNNVGIFSDSIRSSSPPNNSPLAPDEPIDSEGFRSVISHEVGHAVGVPHNSINVTSIMWPTFDWNNILHTFEAADLAAVRVK